MNWDPHAVAHPRGDRRPRHHDARGRGAGLYDGCRESARGRAPAGHRRRVELTKAGQTLLPRARRTLAAEAQAADALRGADRAETCTQSLGVFGSASVVSFQPVLESVAARGVDIRAFEVVLMGRIDVGIGIDYAASPLAPQCGIELPALRSERFSIVGSANRIRALAGLPAGRLTAALSAAPWILPPNDSTFGRTSRFACAQLGIVPVKKYIVTDTAVTLVLAAAGIGVALATPIMRHLAPVAVYALPGLECGGRTIMAMVRTEFAEQAATGAVLDALRRAAARSG